MENGNFMDKKEAKLLINDILKDYREKDYSVLKGLVNSEPDTGEIVGKSGVKYQYEIQVFWDDNVGGNIRAIGNIDNGGWRAFKPISDDFIKDSNNDFIGE